MQRYRLAAKPGLARAGHHIKTKQKPVIIVNKPNSSQSPKSLKNQQPQKVIVKRPPSQTPRSKSKPKIKPAGKIHRQRAKDRASKHQAQYSRLINKLKDVGKGRILVMIACGPSIEETDLPSLQDHPLIDMMSINKPYAKLDPTTYWVFCDQSQYRRNQKTFENFPNTVINAWSVKARHPNQVLVRTRSGKGFSKNLLQGYYIGRSTTYANMQVAYWMNYDKIFIFGCDMAANKNGKLHFYGVNPDVEPKLRITRFEKEAEHYTHGAKQLSLQERMKFYFCSNYNKWSFVEHFNKMDHVEAPSEILEIADKLGEKNGS